MKPLFDTNICEHCLNFISRVLFVINKMCLQTVQLIIISQLTYLKLKTHLPEIGMFHVVWM